MPKVALQIQYWEIEPLPLTEVYSNVLFSTMLPHARQG
jgi:hypothetical protein